jgi:hypothetical protein
MMQQTHLYTWLTQGTHLTVSMMNDWEPFVFAVQSVKGERDCEKISTFKGPLLEQYNSQEPPKCQSSLFFLVECLDECSSVPPFFLATWCRCSGQIRTVMRSLISQPQDSIGAAKQHVKN